MPHPERLETLGLRSCGAHPLSADRCTLERRLRRMPYQTAERRKPSMICGGCHAENDVHQGRFGPQCQECHTTTSFKRPRTN